MRRNQIEAERKLVLGFDAGCHTCLNIAESVQEEVRNKVILENLNSPRMLGWREETLGADAPWAPTLFGIEGDTVLWGLTGWRMAFALSRRLGPIDTWRVMRRLGELDAPSAHSSEIDREPVTGMSRGQFLKNVGGAALAISFFTGVGTPAALAAPSRDAFNVTGMTDGLSMLERVPNSVARQGGLAIKRWLRRELNRQSRSGSTAQSVASCAKEIIEALAYAAFPAARLFKLYKIIRFWGAGKFARALQGAYKGARQAGYGRVKSINLAARTVAKKSGKEAGAEAVSAILALLSIDGVLRECCPYAPKFVPC